MYGRASLPEGQRLHLMGDCEKLILKEPQSAPKRLAIFPVGSKTNNPKQENQRQLFPTQQDAVFAFVTTIGLFPTAGKNCCQRRSWPISPQGTVSLLDPGLRWQFTFDCANYPCSKKNYKTSDCHTVVKKRLSRRVNWVHRYINIRTLNTPRLKRAKYLGRVQKTKNHRPISERKKLFLKRNLAQSRVRVCIRYQRRQRFSVSKLKVSESQQQLLHFPATQIH